MKLEWFVYQNNSVLGPFGTEEVEAQLATNKIEPFSFIWWKGEKDWIPISEWQKNYDSIVSKLEAHFTVLWRVKVDGVTTAHMAFDDCLDYVKSKELKADLYLNQKGHEDWESIYTNTVFMNALEMSRRKFKRVPIVATAKASKADSKFSYMVKVNMIGEGGIGITGLGVNFPVGTRIDLAIESGSLTQLLKVEGFIKYQNKQGITGIEFDTINAETKGVIIEYIKQFSREPSEPSSSAA